MARSRAKQSAQRCADDGELHLGPQKATVYACIEEHGPITAL